ncbi:MAG: rRNA maturation RNase YbeY [Candidatus Acidiferrales bacterium]
MIVNHQRRIAIPLRELNKFLARVGRRLRLQKHTLTVCFVTDAQIARWNRAYRGKNGATDVLSFPTNGSADKRKRGKSQPRRKSNFYPGRDSNSTESRAYLGDIAIAPAVAQRNARRFGRALADEMRILILHGVLHLMGYDHETDEGQMDRLEHRLRRELGFA